MTQNFTFISRDPFARQDVIRMTIHTQDDCKLCGQNRHGHLFQYGIWPDDKEPDFEREFFCSKPCHDQYWNQ